MLYREVLQMFPLPSVLRPVSAEIFLQVLHLFQQKIPSQKTAEDYELSKREKEVLELLVQGKSLKMIGGDLDISYDTVRSHIKKIYDKLHVASMTEAVAKAISEKLV